MMNGEVVGSGFGGVSVNFVELAEVIVGFEVDIGLVGPEKFVTGSEKPETFVAVLVGTDVVVISSDGLVVSTDVDFVFVAGSEDFVMSVIGSIVLEVLVAGSEGLGVSVTVGPDVLVENSVKDTIVTGVLVARSGVPGVSVTVPVGSSVHEADVESFGVSVKVVVASGVFEADVECAGVLVTVVVGPNVPEGISDGPNFYARHMLLELACKEVPGVFVTVVVDSGVFETTVVVFGFSVKVVVSFGVFEANDEISGVSVIDVVGPNVSEGISDGPEIFMQGTVVVGVSMYRGTRRFRDSRC
ncbi:unnamed protein product [Strongylus vulgaris]|uniref:Uncharacterized protein n=1 Tax=Strongylus vulgaris TaxID=40348 RepID=A0A3P7IZ98_STRVU|nr:unnamed protein product [Strongylus vulgaris]